MLNNAGALFARKAAQKSASDRKCADCVHYVKAASRLDPSGCGLFRYADDGMPGDCDDLRARGGSCGEGGAHFELMFSDVMSSRPCSLCVHVVKTDGDHRCLRHLDQSTSAIQPLRCAVLRAVDGECGPEGASFHLSPSAPLLTWQDFAEMRRADPSISYDHARRRAARP